MKPALLLALFGAALLLQNRSHADPVVVFNPLLGEFPEGIAVDPNRNLYVTFPLLGEVRQIAPDGAQTIIAAFEKAPANTLGILGLARDHEGTL